MKPRHKEPTVAAEFRNRIVGHQLIAPDKLLENPLNWRMHSDMQKRAMTDQLKEIGWLSSIIVNKRTGRIVDGHMRVELAKRDREPTVPVCFVDLSEEEERLALATYDPLGDLATKNEQAQRQLSETISTNSDALAEMLKAREKATQKLDDETINTAANEATDQRIEGVVNLNEGAIFSSSNEWGIPDLDADMLADAWPVEVYAGIDKPKDAKRTLFMDDRLPSDRAISKGGILAYYVWDKHFEDIWRDAVGSIAKLSEREFGAVLMPDFSLWRDDPYVVQLWNVYRAFWMARYWQECGFKIVPNIMTGSAAVWPWSIHLLPKKCPVLAVQCRGGSDDKGKAMFVACIREAIKVVKPKRLFIYGGLENRNWIEPNIPKGNYGWLSSVASLRNRMLAEKRKVGVQKPPKGKRKTK